jgi:hypothetical protein
MTRRAGGAHLPAPTADRTPRRRRPGTRTGVAALVGLAGAGAVALGGPGPHGAPPAAAASTVDVAMVIDFGAGAPASLRVIVECLQMAAGSNGSQALAQLAQQLDEPSPSYNGSGLLCSLDGYPTSGCGTATGSGYDYWSYWHGTTGSWVYANAGPATTGVFQGDVEGWRFENPGSGTSSDPPPASPPDFAAICANAAPSPTTTTSAPAAAPPSTAPPAKATTGGSAGTAPGTTTGGANPAASAPGSGSTGNAPLATGPPVTGTTGATRATTTAPRSTTTAPSRHPTAHATAARRTTSARPAEALAATRHPASSDTPVLLGVFGGVALALGVAALVRSRRRARNP